MPSQSATCFPHHMRVRRLSLAAKDGSGAEAGKAELPLVVWGELAVGEALSLT